MGKAKAPLSTPRQTPDDGQPPSSSGKFLPHLLPLLERKRWWPLPWSPCLGTGAISSETKEVVIMATSLPILGSSFPTLFLCWKGRGGGHGHGPLVWEQVERVCFTFSIIFFF